MLAGTSEIGGWFAERWEHPPEASATRSSRPVLRGVSPFNGMISRTADLHRPIASELLIARPQSPASAGEFPADFSFIVAETRPQVRVAIHNMGR